ncbi:TPA: hypothetical protein ACVT6B_002120 [Neisseria meningitidis]
MNKQALPPPAPDSCGLCAETSVIFSQLTLLNIYTGTILSADYRCRFSLFGSAASKTFSRNVLTIHTYPWYEWFFLRVKNAV